MPEKFEDYLNEVKGKVIGDGDSDPFSRRQRVSNYYWNKANDLHVGAIVLWTASEAEAGSPLAGILGFGDWGPYPSSLISSCELLSGLSIELLLKAIARALGKKHNSHHRLNDLRRDVGIDLSADQDVTLAVLTECIYWDAKYPTPKTAQHFSESLKVFSKLRKPGDLAMKKFSVLNDARAVNVGNYGVIWGELSHRYWRIKDVTMEH